MNPVTAESPVNGNPCAAGHTRARIRVLILIKGLGLGGAEQLLVNAAQHLNRDVFDYSIGYFLPWKDALVEELEAHGLPVTCFNSRRVSDWRAIGRVANYIRENEIQVLHTHLPWAGIVGRFAARRCRVPAVVYTEHGLWSRLHPVTRAVNRWTIGLNDTSIAVSGDVSKSMSCRRGHDLRTIANGIDCSRFDDSEQWRQDARRELGIPADDVVIAKVANLSPVKNHEMLIRAFARCQQAVPHAFLLLIGQLRDRDELLRQLASELGVGSRVLIAGPRKDVPRLLAAADVFAMSSRSEGLPVSLLEAMASAIPPVCTSVGGIPGVVTNGESGFLVSPDDVNDMARRLTELAGDRSLRTQIGTAARVRVRSEFDVKSMVEQTENVYLEILNRKRVLDRDSALR